MPYFDRTFRLRVNFRSSLNSNNSSPFNSQTMAMLMFTPLQLRSSTTAFAS